MTTFFFFFVVVAVVVGFLTIGDVDLDLDLATSFVLFDDDDGVGDNNASSDMPFLGAFTSSPSTIADEDS